MLDEKKQQTLVSKIAADKNSKKLGKIIRVEKIKDRKSRNEKPYAFILEKRFLLKDIIVLLPISKVTKIEANYVWFDILKKDFKQEAKETRALMQDLYG